MRLALHLRQQIRQAKSILTQAAGAVLQEFEYCHASVVTRIGACT
jgi:hypothetical protein